MVAGRDELVEQVAALKHDLGKYVAWMSANLGDDHWHGPLRDELFDALTRDLLRTRSTADGEHESAWDVWQRFAAGWPSPLPEPELVTVEAAVAVLRSFEPALRAGDRAAIASARPAIRAAQQTIRSELQQLSRRLQRRG
jgi:hypothetical protein